MPSQVLHESKHIAKRVLIGAATGVLGAVIIYFLGYTKSPDKISEIELKKGTIKAWKAYIPIENNFSIAVDTLRTKLYRGAIDLMKFCKEDSLLSLQFAKDIEKLLDDKALDKDLSIMLKARVFYRQESTKAWNEYRNGYNAIRDSSITLQEKNQLVKWLDQSSGTKMTNIFERTYRSIEDLAASLAKKYDYAFSLSDFRAYPSYLTVKKSKSQPATPEVAPSDPNNSGPVLPD